jgi:DNA-binding PadR family transcriptional regulator
MTREQREQVRLSLLRICESADEYGLATGLLAQFVRNEGFRSVTPGEVVSELVYLADKGLVASVKKPISPENQAWRITAAGRDLLAERGGN